jgi:hypothetical protein
MVNGLYYRTYNFIFWQRSHTYTGTSIPALLYWFLFLRTWKNTMVSKIYSISKPKNSLSFYGSWSQPRREGKFSSGMGLPMPMLYKMSISETKGQLWHPFPPPSWYCSFFYWSFWKLADTYKCAQPIGEIFPFPPLSLCSGDGFWPESDSDYTELTVR